MRTSHADEARRRRYILSELRHALVLTKLAQVDIETAVLALDRHLVTPEQAVAMFWESPAVGLLGPDFSARQAVQTGSCHHEAPA